MFLFTASFFPSMNPVTDLLMIAVFGPIAGAMFSFGVMLLVEQFEEKMGWR